MKRFILSFSLIAMGTSLLAPSAVARQVSLSELGEGATLSELVRYNRDARNKR